MGFPPLVPQIYMDPSNWQEQQITAGFSQEIELCGIQPPQQALCGGGGNGVASRPTSTAERARMARVPPPETSLRCPRCESTNTKFCYFNNYSLSQPRHFCKTCRRYWTRGGALRNVPVGGGCRRNKRGKTNKPKSPITPHLPLSHQPLVPSLQTQVQVQPPEGYFGFAPMTNDAGEEWRMPQFPLLEGPSTNLGFYNGTNKGLLEASASNHEAGLGGLKDTGASGIGAFSRNFLGINYRPPNELWETTAASGWTDFSFSSGLSTSSSSLNRLF